VQDCWLPTPLACFPFTSPPVRHRVPPDSACALHTCTHTYTHMHTHTYTRTYTCTHTYTHTHTHALTHAHTHAHTHMHTHTYTLLSYNKALPPNTLKLSTRQRNTLRVRITQSITLLYIFSVFIAFARCTVRSESHCALRQR